MGDAGADGGDDGREPAPIAGEREVAERTRYLAVAQHKLRTPLAVIAGWSTTLQNWEVLPPEERVGGLEAINRAIADLQAQIDDVVDEARAQLLGQSLRPGPVDLHALVDEQVAALGAEPAVHPIEVAVPPGTEVMADPRALGLVVAHLLDNAVKYSPSGGAIAISAASGGGTVVLRIADHGVGIPEDEVDVFEAFRRGNSAARVARGTGLGLHVVRSLTERMGGEVTAHNGEHGAVVELTLPSP